MMLQKSDLKPEQNAAIDRLYSHDETLLVAGVGFGKAVIGLTTAQELIHDGILKRVLVLAPKQVCALTYADEPSKWQHLDSDMIQVLSGTPKQRLKQLADPSKKIIICNFELVTWLMKFTGDKFDGMLIDELSKLKSVGGSAFKKLRHFAKKMSWRAGMSATPVAECGADLYGQCMLLDCGAALGTRKMAFLESYMVPLDWERRNWDWAPGKLELAAERLAALVYIPDETSYAAALPPVVDEITEVEMPDDAREVYDIMKGHGIVKLMGPVGTGEVAAGSQGVRTGKMQQIACGGLYGKDYDDEQVLVAEWLFKEKAFRTYMRGIDHPVFVIYQYAFELDWLQRMYPDAPVLGAGNKVSSEAIADWNAGKVPVLIAHPKSCAHGLNLQGACSHLIHLGPVWSADQHHQTLGRLRRRGQKADYVKRTTFVATDTIEETMMDRQDTKTIRAGVASAALKAASN